MTDTEATPMVYTTKELAQLYKTTPRTLMKWVVNGDFPYPDIYNAGGSNNRWHRAKIERFQKTGKVK